MERRSDLTAVVALTTGFAILSSVALAQTSAPTLKTAEHKEHGEHLTDGSGMSLYLFEEDRPEGDRGRSVESDCAGDCLDRWPVFTGENPPKVEGNADRSEIGSFERPDGRPRRPTTDGRCTTSPRTSCPATSTDMISMNSAVDGTW